MSTTLGVPRMRATLLSTFAGIALLLAAIGVYGLLSYSVAGRRREIGIRLALGATASQVSRKVVAEGMRLACLGIAVGVVLALALSRFITSQLFGVGAGDPATFAGVTLVLALVALVACWLPARRVLRIDPVSALRME